MSLGYVSSDRTLEGTALNPKAPGRQANDTNNEEEGGGEC